MVRVVYKHIAPPERRQITVLRRSLELGVSLECGGLTPLCYRKR